MFYGRKRELRELDERYNSGRFEFLPIYGRRRVGKTAFLREFMRDHPGILYTANNHGLKANIDGLASALLGVEASTTIEAVLDWIRRRSESERLLLVIDEYPRIVRSDPVFGEYLQEFIDDIHGDSKLFLILCGSSRDAMIHEVMAYSAPLYGRRTGSMEIRPLDIWDSMGLLEGFGREDAARIYGMVGGIPMYLRLFDSDRTLGENVAELFLREHSPLRNEHIILLIEEVEHPFLYERVMDAVARGNVTVGDVAERCGLETSAASRYLGKLVSMGLVEKQRPVDNPEGRMTRYRISDPFLRFLFSRVLPVIDVTDPEDPREIADSILGSSRSNGFTDLCTQHLRRVHGGSPGTWWGTDRNTRTPADIDIIVTRVVDGEFTGWFAECDTGSEPVGTEVLDGLRYRMALVKGYGERNPVIYSGSGFTDALLAENGVELYTLDDILDGKGIRR